ncbi:MAG: RNase P subunit p30 family protein [Nanoarchaeota archaeon]
MIDIIDFEYKGEMLGFTRFYTFKDFKIEVGGDDNKNRKIVENKKVDIFLSPEKTRTKDFMHSRDSGLNQVLCKLARKNEITVGFNFNDILKSRNRSLILGKMIQNVELCRKYNVKMVILSGAKNRYELRSAKDLVSFGRVIGMTPGEAKKALNFDRKKV